jgi:hypothetical protein
VRMRRWERGGGHGERQCLAKPRACADGPNGLQVWSGALVVAPGRVGGGAVGRASVLVMHNAVRLSRGVSIHPALAGRCCVCYDR